MCKCGAVQEGYYQTIRYEIENIEEGWNNTDTNFCLYATIIEKVRCNECQEEDTIFHYMREEEF